MMRTYLLPVTLRYFHPSGFFTRLRTSYIKQKVELVTEDKADDKFMLVDVAAGFRLPKRYGIVSIEVRNLFDKGFNFQGIDSRTPQRVSNAPFLPERTIFVRLTLAF